MLSHASVGQLRFFLRTIQIRPITPYNVLIWATISTKGRIIATHDENREIILIVDDSAMNRMLLSDILSDTYNIIEAEDGEQAIAILQQHASEISIVVLDMVMPKVDGFGVLEAMNENRWIQFLPVVSISTESSPEFVERAYSLGVTDFINRPFDELIVIRRVSNTIKLYAKQRKLTNMVANEIFEKERNGSLMITILSHIVEFRNGESGMHVINIGTLTEILLNQISKKDDRYYLPYAERDLIVKASALHDIGKISIPEEVLNKPGKLTDEEFEAMKQHTVIGYQMLSDLGFQDEPLVKVSREITRWHHERYDGRGYPDGLKGDEIPLSAQIVSLADVYDALTSERVYKPAFSHEKAIQMILNGECGAFNPLLLECLVEAQDAIRQGLAQPNRAFNSYEDLKSIAPAIQDAETLDVTEYALDQLENEREKNHFLTEISRQLQFDYNKSLDLLHIPVWAAKRLGTPAQIKDPLHTEALANLISHDLVELLSKAITETTPQDPLVRLDCTVTSNGEAYDCIIITKTVWSQEEEPILVGVIGKIMQNNGDTTWLDAPFELPNSHTPIYIHNVTPEEIEITMANQVPSEVVETLYQIAGGDYAGVIGRLRTNERIAKFVTMFADDASYTNLIDNMAAENWDEAFRAAHTLKGTARDMGFIDLSDRASEVTEALRASDAAQAKELLPAVEDAYKQVADAIAMFR